MSRIIAAIRKINSSAQVAIIGADQYSNIDWGSGEAIPEANVLAQLALIDKANKWADIMRERDRKSDVGGYLVAGKWFHSDQKSRGQQLGLVLLGASMPTGIEWKTMDGTFITMTPTLAEQILFSAAASDVAIFSAAEAHKAAMEASADPASYDFSAGWPPVFGD